MTVRIRRDPATQTRAVLTGDLVGSRRLSNADLDRARSLLLTATLQVERWTADLVGSPADFFRGDSWQLLLLKPGYFLRAAAYVRARLKAVDEAFDTRVAIGLGHVSQVSRERTSLSAGEAFELSGQALDRMGGSGNMVVAWPQSVRSWGALDPLVDFVSVLVDGWTSKQADVASLALAPHAPTQVEIAERLGISQQAVSKALSAAKIGSILKAASYCEALNWNAQRWI